LWRVHRLGTADREPICQLFRNAKLPPLTNAASLLMFYGMFGSIFLLRAFLPGRPALQPAAGRPAALP